MDRSEQLRDAAQQVLSETGCEDVDAHLDSGDIRAAESYILGALDRKVADNAIDVDAARALYKMLNIDLGRANSLRAHNTSGGSA